jgi:hypothetical protein
MPNYYGPRIVTDGLVLCLDAGNPKSYPGSGTAWTDLSRNGNNGTLTNGPTYNSANGGSIVFDGTDDVITCGTTSPPSGDLSVFAWVYSTSFNSTWNIISTKWFSGSGSDFHWALKSDLGNGTNIKQNLYTTSNSDIYGTTTFLINTWYYVGFTLVNGGTLTFYKNGVSDGTSSTVSRTAHSSTLQLGDSRGVNFGLIGRIPQVSIYKRALTPSEILQNYNATKGRFKL